ncbi:MAG TPA: LysR substrate-binding domain-containing protein, partial [Steroidobacteraceae bacterium]|nr:LysR substrate-binding domain-containing protein [Steroidobacteraceae bacterium]
RIGEDFTAKDTGRLVVATTHMHARYVLRDVIRDFIGRHPHVQLVLRQATPAQTAQLVASGEADIGVSSQPSESVNDLVMLPCYELHRSVIAPKGHPLLGERRLTLRSIARYPIITLDQSFVGGSAVLRAFAAARIRPNVVLSAIDADVVKTYVELGLGIAILPSIAYEPRRDTRLRAIDAAKLFEPTIACIELRRENYLRSYMLDFIQRIAPQWSRETIARAMRTGEANSRQGASWS